MKKKLNLSPKMMEQLKNDEALQIKGGTKATDTNSAYVCATVNKCTINNCKKVASSLG